MARIDVILPEEMEKRFRDEVYKRKGLKRGNMTEAIQEALVLWMGNEEPRRKSPKSQ